MLWRSRSIMLAICALTLFWSTTAMAQDDPDGTGVAAVSSATSTTYLLPTSVGLTTTGGIITLISMLTRDSGRAELFIRNNAQALAQHISTGGGETVRDLVEIYQVDKDKRAAFATMLRELHTTLVPLTDRNKLNRERAKVFFMAIYFEGRARELVAAVKI